MMSEELYPGNMYYLSIYRQDLKRHTKDIANVSLFSDKTLESLVKQENCSKSFRRYNTLSSYINREITKTFLV